MAEGRMTGVVTEPDRLGQIFVQPQRARNFRPLVAGGTLESFSLPPVAQALDAVLKDDPQNPHRLFQCDRRGYVTVDVTPETWQADFRTVRVATPTSAGETGASPSGTAGLYFELRVDGRAVDPLQWLKRP